MAGEDSDGHDDARSIPFDYYPKFYDDGNDIDNYGFSNILLNPDQYDHRYLPESPDFFEDMQFDPETEVNDNEFRQLLQADEHDAVTLVENAANPNENHFDAHDVGYVPQEPILPLKILSDQGDATDVFEFSHPEEHDDADILIGDTNPSENHSLGHDFGDFPINADYPSHEHIIEEHHVSGFFTSSEQLGSDENDSRGNKTERWPGWPGQNVFRLLVPVKKVGCIIGPKGEYVKKTIEETKARIKVLRGPPGITERVVLISARELPHCTMPPAVEGLLRVHEQLLNDTAYATSNAVCSIITRLLVPDSQGRSLVGKQGFTIRSIQEASGCSIRVLRSGSRPVFALNDDSVVEIHGESAGVHKAVELVALYLRKYLVDSSIIEVFEAQMQRLNVPVNNNMPPPQTWGPPPPQRAPAPPAVAAGRPDFAPNHQYMPPSHHYGNYYPPAILPPMDNHLHQDPPPAYATNSSMEIHSSSVEPQLSVETKDTQHMQIPMSYANAVIGASGVNISYIRGASGASITVRETKGVPGEMTIEIIGTCSEIQAAKLLVQNFVAGAASAEQYHMKGSHSQGDNSYAPSPPSGAGDDTGHVPSANYVPLHGTNFGH